MMLPFILLFCDGADLRSHQRSHIPSGLHAEERPGGVIHPQHVASICRSYIRPTDKILKDLSCRYNAGNVVCARRAIKKP
jgi:hypothetical protein